MVVASPQEQKGAKQMGEWIDTRDCVPLEDGYYLVQTVYGEVYGYSYTSAGGWNSFYTTEGELRDKSAINDGYVVRWFNAPKPDAVPEDWYEEHLYGEGVKL